MAGGRLAAEQPPRFSAICQSDGHGTAATAVDNHTVIQHTCVNGITLALWNRCFGTMAQYCFHDASLGPN